MNLSISIQVNFNENVTIYSIASQVSHGNTSQNDDDCSSHDNEAHFDEDTFDENALEVDDSFEELEQHSQGEIEDSRRMKPSLFLVSLAM